MKRLEDVIRRPLVTEKSTILSRANNQYVFAVDLKANKQEIGMMMTRVGGEQDGE